MAATIVHFELPAADAGRATAFYSGLLGWHFSEAGISDVDYRMVQGEPGGAVYQTDDAARGVTIYFGTDDIDASLAKVRELGGSGDDKAPVAGIGWFARCTDTEGNAFSLFQSDDSVAPPT